MRPFVNDGSGWKQAGDNLAFVQRYCRYGFDIKHYQLQFSWTFSKVGQEALLTDDRYSELLKSHEFRVVPMMNPDGVVLGNFRTSYSGKDLNRQFLNPDRRVYP
ncbi:unnamed protein product [Sphagnum balticum]